jgi:hypothetical protein
MKKVVICVITTLILLLIVLIFFVFCKNNLSSSKTLIETMTNENQHYPPGTHENYNSFLSGNLMMGKGKELEFPEGWGGGKGEPWVPPNNNKWSQKTIKNFLHFQKTFNPLYIFDISILQTQATEQDVEYLLQNNRWPWTNETKKQFKDAIAHNEIIQVDPGIALDQSQSVYNETAMKQILYWNTAEGKFLLYGGLTKDGNILRCSQDAKNMEVIHNLGYGPANPHKSIPNDEIQTIFPPFRFLQSNTNNSCNPCIKINDPLNNSCPFTLSF